LCTHLLFILEVKSHQPMLDGDGSIPLCPVKRFG